MKMLRLRIKKYHETTGDSVYIHDELFTGLLRNEFFVVTQAGEMRHISMLLDLFYWPKTYDDGKWVYPQLYSFLTGHSPEMAKRIEWYEA